VLERPSQEGSGSPQGRLETPSDAETSLGTAGKICSTRPFSPILSPFQGLLSGPKSFSHGQNPEPTKLPFCTCCYRGVPTSNAFLSC
jgi:hypothetical protein